MSRLGSGPEYQDRYPGLWSLGANKQTTEVPMSLRSGVQNFWVNRQKDLFPQVEEELGQLSGRYRQLLHVLAVVPV